MVSYTELTMNRNDLILTREKEMINKDEEFGEDMEFCHNSYNQY